MTKNVENWTYKSKAELEALSPEKRKEVYDDLKKSIQLFHEMRVPFTDEMTWLLMVLPSIKE